MQDAHRLFLQTFMYHGIMKGKEVKDSHKRAVEHFKGNYNEADLVHFVKTVNDNIRPFHLEIKKAVDEVTESHFYVLVNKAETLITRQSSDFTVNQLELFKKLISAVVESDDGLLSSTEALNLSGQLEGVKMSKKDAAKLFELLKQKKWINEDNGSYYLGPRSVTELEAYILEEYESATKCHLCQKLCLHGQNCDECDIRLHVFCASRCFRGARNMVCPSEECRAPWRHAIRNMDDDEPTSTPQTNSRQLSQRTAKRSRRQ